LTTDIRIGIPRPLDDRARAAAPGQFARLSDGWTHYEVQGPERATPVVLVHGFSVPAFIWDPTFEALAGAGFRVLRYDLFGRGYSDRPRGAYDLDRFDRQLVELVDAVGLGLPVDLVGLSMGGALAVGVTDRHPGLVRKLVLVDPVGFPMAMSPGMSLLRVPLLGEILMFSVVRVSLVSGITRDFSMPEKLPELARRYRVQMTYRGFMRALLSTHRHGLVTSMGDAYARVGRQPRQVLLIWGREDRTAPFSLSTQVRAALPQAEFHPIEGAGHVPHLERPEVVHPILIEFLHRKLVQ